MIFDKECSLESNYTIFPEKENLSYIPSLENFVKMKNQITKRFLPDSLCTGLSLP